MVVSRLYRRPGNSFEVEFDNLFSINLLNGTVLVDGVPLGLLSSSVVNDPLYKRTFGDRNFEMVVLGFRHYRTARRVEDRFLYDFWLTPQIPCIFLRMIPWRALVTSCCSFGRIIWGCHLCFVKNIVTGFLKSTELSPCVNHRTDSDASSTQSQKQQLTLFHPNLARFLFKKSLTCFQAATSFC